MSRIFDALQRSGIEQTGVEYPDTVSVATHVFETPEAPEQEEVPAIPLEDFPSLEVSVEPSCRLVFLTEPESLSAEKFRFLGVRMRQLQQSRPIKKVLVTSTIAEEGKSLVSANLAGVLARRKRHKVLLVEGDLRRPVLARKFGLGKLEGLSEWLRGDAESAGNIYHLRGPDFWLMPAGHPPTNPLELMQSARLSALMGQVTSMFDWIIVDSPPLLPLADTTVWARLTDGVLLVVREGTAEKTPLQRGLEILKKADLLGVVLNSSSNENHHNYYQRYAAAAREIKNEVKA
jgi:capsular exopolysaccharide synthesis family protein